MIAYKRRPAAALTWIRFDDSEYWVVNFPGAAQTHLLTAAARRLWQLLPEQQPLTVEQLTPLLSAEIGVPLDDALRKSTQETLEFLDRTGLIEFVAA